MTAHTEFVAAVKATGFTVYDGAVPALPKPAYVLVESMTPRPIGRAMSRDRHGREARWRLTVASNAPAGVLAMRDRLQALDGSRVAGERVEDVDTGVDVTLDPNVVIQGAPVWYTKLEYRVSLPL